MTLNISEIKNQKLKAIANHYDTDNSGKLNSEEFAIFKEKEYNKIANKESGRLSNKDYNKLCSLFKPEATEEKTEGNVDKLDKADSKEETHKADDTKEENTLSAAKREKYSLDIVQAIQTAAKNNQTITLDISANDSVFNKLFRSFGMMSQGNLVKTDEEGNLANADEINQLVNQAMDLLQSAVDNNGKSTNGKNETLSLVIAKVSSNYVTLNNVQNTLEAVQTNLEDSIDSVKNVDQTEATVKLLAAQNSLEASYEVLTSALNLSLLNYLD